MRCTWGLSTTPCSCKLLRCIRGAIFDVIVDLRAGSPTYGHWHGERLDDQNRAMICVPEGFAHGFVALSEHALFTYLCTATYDPAADANVRWDDPAIGIDWPVAEPLLSPKDAVAPLLADIPLDRLPVYEGA